MRACTMADNDTTCKIPAGGLTEEDHKSEDCDSVRGGQEREETYAP